MRHRLFSFLIVLTCFVATAPAAERVFTATAIWSDAPPRAGQVATLEIAIAIDDGWHINSNLPRDPYLIPTSIRLELPPGWSASEPHYPPHRLVSFTFSDDQLAVFEDTVSIQVEIQRSAEATPVAMLRGLVAAQACNQTTCLAPEEAAFTVPTGIEGAPAAEIAANEPPLETFEAADSTSLGGRFLSAGILLQLGLVFLAGLALNLTPCVYPLIPITVGFFLAQKEVTRRRTWLLATTYVLGMSVTYSALGVAAALTGRLFGSALQSPWLVGIIVATLLALAASMFGLWEIRIPTWASRVSGSRSGVGGALVMGLVVGLVAAPCIGPFVLGLLTYVGRQQSVVLGFGLFFTLSLGLGLPYLFLAVFSGAMERMPNSGAWMIGVRNLFGVLLIALAAFFIRPFLVPRVGDQIFAAVLVLGGLFLLVIARPGHDQPWVDRAMRLASATILAAGVLLFPKAGIEPRQELHWTSYDQAAVEAALASGAPVIMDFYADWCAPCKELDEKTFSDPAVASGLAHFQRFKVDLTRADQASDAVRRRYQVVGVPTVAFFTAGEEARALRLTGYEPPEAFLRRLERTSSP